MTCSTNVTKYIYIVFLLVGVDSSICAGSSSGVVYTTGDVLGENESQHTYILQSRSHRKGKRDLSCLSTSL